MRISAFSFFILSITSSAFLAVASARAADDRMVSVNGNCLKSVQPDRGSVSFFAESLQSDANRALTLATKDFQSAREAVVQLKLKNMELSTLENGVSPVNEWEKNKNVFKGYRARLGLRVYTTELTRLGEVLAEVTKLGIKNVDGIQVDFSPQKLKDEQESCLETAVQNARSKAERMAKAGGARVGRVVSIDENGGNIQIPPRPMMMMSKAMDARMTERDDASPIDVKSEDISTSVRVSFKLE